MSTGKTILVVAGVGVGAYLLLRALAPARTAPVTNKLPATTSTGTALLGLIPAIGGLFSSSGQSSSSSTNTPYNAGVAQGTFEAASTASLDAGTGYGDQAAALNALFPGLV